MTEEIKLNEINEVVKGIYMTEVPLRGNPLKMINIYVVKTPEKNMIVDTGFNTEEIRGYMDGIIKELDLTPDKTILYCTHLHSDHLGLAAYLNKKGYEVLLSEVDAWWVENGFTKEGEHWQRLIDGAYKQGLLEEGLKIEDHPGFKFRPTEHFDYTPVNPGDIIEVGDFKFEAIDLAGHTPGMVGLYEPNVKVFFCGDHILGKITPNITFWHESVGDSLGTYLKNLEKMKDFEIDHLLSSHRFLITDIPARVEELKAHHAKRLDEARETIKKYGKVTALEVTKHLNWDIRAKDWNDFPDSQKWFAVGEAQAHLEYLISHGEVKEEVQENGIALYSFTEN